MIDTLTFETLYERYKPLVRRRLHSLLVRYPDEIEDALQDTFVKAWRSLCERTEPVSNLSAWLTHIATNTALDVLKSTRIKRCHSLDVPLVSESGSEQTLAEKLSDPVDSFQAVEWQETLTRLRQHLPVRDVTLLLLSAQGYSISEMAARFHLSSGRVKNLLCQARAAARHAVQQQPA